MHPESIWSMLEQTRDVHVTLSHVMQVRRNDPDGGVGKSCGRYWEQIMGEMYSSRLSMVWPHTSHLCLTADSSTHSYNDVLLAVAYSHELNQGSYPWLQYIRPGKELHESEEVLTGNAE